jgi:hypothetical protein
MLLKKVDNNQTTGGGLDRVRFLCCTGTKVRKDQSVTKRRLVNCSSETQVSLASSLS